MTLLERIDALFARIARVTGRIPSADTTAPSIILSGPSQPVTAAGFAPLVATVSDNVGVKTVTFYRGQELLGSRSLAPWTWPAPIRAGDNGAVVFRAVAEDAAGNRKEALPLTVTVNIAPTVALNAAPRTTPGRVLLTATPGDDANTASVTFSRVSPNPGLLGTDSTSPFTFEDPDALNDSNNGARTYSATATDRQGNTSPVATASAAINIPSPSDTTPPSISLNANPKPVTAAGRVTVTASPLDNVGVVRVEFARNSPSPASLGTKTSPPWTVQDPTDLTAANNGTRSYSAQAFDAAGNASPVAVVDVPVNIAATPPPASGLYVEPDPATIQWGPQVVITDAYLDSRGIVPLTTGLYAGRSPVTLSQPARNLVTGECAVWVNTTRPLLLRHSTICGVAGGGTGRGAIGNGKYGAPVGNSVNVDVVIEDCTLINPGAQMVTGQSAGGLRFAYAKNVIVRNSNINGMGVLVAELIPGSSGGTVKVERNFFKNIDGRIVDRNSPTGYKVGNQSGVHFVMAQATQLDKVRNVAGINLGDNRVENLPGQSRAEDNFNTYQSGGTVGSPLMLFRNLIDGSYAANPNNATSGSGMVFGDEGGDNTWATDNTVVRTSNTGVSMSSMNNGRILRNKIMQTGFLPDGSRVDDNGSNIDSGVYARNYAAGSGFVMDKTSNIVDDNDVSWGAPLNGAPLRRLDYGFSQWASTGPIGNRTYGDASDAKIAGLIADHLAVWAAAGVVVGRRNP